ncbi:MAG: SEC-C metal-binding domain-containing protein, partial [bacterium]
IMEERFPEFEVWKAQVEREHEERKQIQKRRSQMEPWDALQEALQDIKSDGLERSQRRQNDSNQFSRADFETTRKIGRNNPCPCGSGKKYKKCCLKTQDEA